MDNTTSVETVPSEARSLSQYEDYYPWMASVNAVLTTCGIPGNLLTIAAYWKYETVRTPTNTLIVSQSVGDLFTSLTSPLMIFFHFTLIGQHIASMYKYACLTGLITLLISVESSATNLLALSVERFIAVYFSLEYYNWVTERSVKIVVIVIWSAVLSFNCLPLFGLNTWQVGATCWPLYIFHKSLFLVSFVIPIAICLLAIAVLSFLVAVAALKKERAFVPATAAVAAVAPKSQLPEEAAKRRKQEKVEFRITKMLFMVVGTFYACWIPALVGYGLLLKPPSVWLKNGIPAVMNPLGDFFKGLIGFNTFLNPFIYAYKSSTFRRAFCKLLNVESKVSGNYIWASEPKSTQT